MWIFVWTAHQYYFLSVCMFSFMCWNLYCTFGIILLVFIQNSNWAHELEHTTLPTHYYFLYWGAMTKILLKVSVSSYYRWLWKRLTYALHGKEGSCLLGPDYVSKCWSVFLVFSLLFLVVKNMFECSWFIARFFYLSSLLSAFSSTCL